MCDTTHHDVLMLQDRKGTAVGIRLLTGGQFHPTNKQRGLIDRAGINPKLMKSRGIT